MNNIYSEFLKTGFEFDRVATDKFQLPYSQESIIIQPNELATSSVINIKLEKLYTNFLYLYGLCNMVQFQLGDTYSGWIGVSGVTDWPYNLIADSNNFNAWDTIQAATITSNTGDVVDPNGTNTASKMLETATTNLHRVYQLPVSGANTAGPYTFSTYIKGGLGRDFATLFIYNTTDGNVAGAVFDIVNGDINQSALVAGTSFGIVSAGNGWYRCYVTGNATVSGSGVFVSPYNAAYAYAGDVTKGIYMWGAQLTRGDLQPYVAGYYDRSVGITKFFNPNTSVALASTFAVGGTKYGNIFNSVAAKSFLSGNKNNIIVADRTTLTLFSLDINNTLSFVKTQSLVDPLSGTLYFQNIADIETDGSANLYVLDKTLNNLYQYDLASIYTDDYVFSQKLFLEDTVGGLGDRYDNLKFNTPSNLVYTGSEIVVEDTGNKAFKVYDKNLNFLNLTVAISLFDAVSSGFNSLAYDAQNRQIIGTTDKNIYLLDYGTDYSVTSASSYGLGSLLDADEVINDLLFATYEPSICYLVTNKKWIKKWVYKTNSNIGIYESNSLLGSNFNWATTSSYGNSATQLCVYTYNNSLSDNPNNNFISVFNDKLDLITLLKQPNFNIYDLNDIQIASDEYTQSWVYNKSFKKLFYNMQLLIGNIAYRFFEGLDANGTPIFVDRGYNDFLFTSEIPSLNYFANVYVNESFQSSTINRDFAALCAYQQYLVENIVSNKPVYGSFIKSIDYGGSKFTYITYTSPAADFLLNPAPMQQGGDTFLNSAGGLTITGPAPYDPGEGISITIV